jgi:putative FmdB family regulatory protein
MLYDYGCHNCGETLKDVKQSIHDEALKKCPSCGQDSLERVPYGGLGSFMKHNANTIGSQADKNWSNLGHYQRSDIESQSKSKSEERTKRDSRAVINNMTAEQKTNYIMTGKKP